MLVTQRQQSVSAPNGDTFEPIARHADVKRRRQADRRQQDDSHKETR